MTSRKLSTMNVQERRLRPIYELLDAGNNRKALADADRMLRRTPDYSLAKVVKALALIRMNKENDAFTILEEVIREGEVNGFTVGDTTQILLTCYKELNQPHMVCGILEHLCAKVNSEQVLVQYFMSLVRIQDFRKMHQIALTLYKGHPYNHPAYFSWAISSLFLQYENFVGPLDQNATLSFELAERMIDKYLMDFKTKHPGEEFQDQWNLMDLYIRLMIRQTTKWGKILDIFKIKGYPPQDLSLWTWDCQHECYCYVMEQAGFQMELLKHLQDLFLEHKDFALLKQIIDNFGNDAATRDKTIQFMNELRTHHGSFVVAMANIYFATKDDQLHDTEDKRKQLIIEDLEMAIKCGIERQNFFPDAVEHFKLVDHATQCKLLEIMEKLTSVPKSVEEINLKMSNVEIIKDVNYELTRRDVLGQKFDLRQRIEQANFCFGKYLKLKHGRDNNNLDADIQRISASRQRTEAEVNAGSSDGDTMDEIEYLDQYVLIAASILLSEHQKLIKKATDTTGKDLPAKFGDLTLTEEEKEPGQMTADKDKRFLVEELLITAISIMEYCLARSPLNSTLRLVLANAYGRLGASTEMLKIMDEINIKHIQLDSLGYLLLPLVITTGAYPRALMMLRQGDVMYSTFENENMEYVIAAYDTCNFKQVSEFNNFRDQLLHSTQCGLILVEKRLMEYMTCTQSIEMLNNQADQILLELDLFEISRISCGDNRDLCVIQNLFDDGVNWDEFRTVTAKMNIHWFQERLCLMTFTTKLITTGKKIAATEDIDDELIELEKSLEAWKNVCEKWEEFKEEKDLNTPFFGVYPPRHVPYFDLSVPQRLMKQADCVIKIMGEKDPDAATDHLRKLQEIMSQDAKSLLKILEDDFKVFLNNQNYMVVDSCLQKIHFVLEFFAFSKIIIAVAIGTMKNLQSQDTSNKGKAKGKKGKSGKHVDISVVIKNILEFFKKLHKFLCEFIDFVKKRPQLLKPNGKWIGRDSDDFMETNFLMGALPSKFNMVLKNIRSSHLDQLIVMSKTAESMVQFVLNL